MKNYTVKWNQVKGEPLAVGQIVQWMGIHFRVEAIEYLPETKTTFNNAKLQVSYVRGPKDILELLKKNLESDNAAVGPI